MSGHDVAPTTHTPELRQLEEINECLTDDGGRNPVTAADLRLAGVPAAAVLSHLSADGPPDFPYILGHFRTGGPDGGGSSVTIPLHTASLHQISTHFGLRHRWGA